MQPYNKNGNMISSKYFSKIQLKTTKNNKFTLSQSFVLKQKLVRKNTNNKLFTNKEKQRNVNKVCYININEKQDEEMFIEFF